MYQEAAAEVPELNVSSRKVDDRRSTMVFQVMSEQEKADAKQAELQAKLDNLETQVLSTLGFGFFGLVEGLRAKLDNLETHVFEQASGFRV